MLQSKSANFQKSSLSASWAANSVFMYAHHLLKRNFFFMMEDFPSINGNRENHISADHF